MNAEQELLNAYREWHRLARAEAKAIRTHNWSLLADCQLAITDFQKLISRLSLDARREWETAGLDCAAKESAIKVFAAELIDLTQQNRVLLQQVKDEACAQLENLGEAGRNLHRLQRSYGSAAGFGLPA
jgi:hypothetical protein